MGYVWLAIGLEPLYVDTGRRIESAEDLCRECLESIGMDTLYLTDNDHGLENADPLERAEIRRRWKPFMEQLPQFAYSRSFPISAGRSSRKRTNVKACRRPHEGPPADCS